MAPVIIIPARYGSSRFPGKPLAEIAGKTLIEHTWRAAARTGLGVVIATDHVGIARTAMKFGADVVTTGEATNGTERCALAAKALKIDGPVINWQGDSPLVPHHWIPSLIAALREGADVATPVQRCTPQQSDILRHEFIGGRPGGTLAVLDHEFRALYFSKAPIPYRGPWWLHVGIYAYTAEALRNYGREEGILEKSEQLEQLRFIERGMTIQAIPFDGRPIWEVNNPDDVYRVEELMRGAMRA